MNNFPKDGSENRFRSRSFCAFTCAFILEPLHSSDGTRRNSARCQPIQPAKRQLLQWIIKKRPISRFTVPVQYHPLPKTLPKKKPQVKCENNFRRIRVLTNERLRGCERFGAPFHMWILKNYSRNSSQYPRKRVSGTDPIPFGVGERFRRPNTGAIPADRAGRSGALVPAVRGGTLDSPARPWYKLIGDPNRMASKCRGLFPRRFLYLGVPP